MAYCNFVSVACQHLLHIAINGLVHRHGGKAVSVCGVRESTVLSAKGESAKGESAKGESAKGEGFATKLGMAASGKGACPHDYALHQMSSSRVADSKEGCVVRVVVPHIVVV